MEALRSAVSHRSVRHHDDGRRGEGEGGGGSHMNDENRGDMHNVHMNDEGGGGAAQSSD